MKSQYLALVAALFVLPQANGAIVISGDPGAGTGVFTITEDITINVTLTGDMRNLIFDEWVANDGSQQGGYLSPSSFDYTINGGSLQTLNNFRIFDNYNNNFAALTENDGYLLFDSVISVTAGDVLVLKAGTWSMPALPGFNPDALGVFSGNVFITSTSGTALSAIPEPSSALLALLAGGLLLRRKR